MIDAPTESAPRTPSFHRAIVYTSSGTILNIAALFIETILAARVLPEESYGIYVILIAVVNFLVVVVDFGCKTSVTKMLASADKAQQAILANTTTVFRILIILAISALVWVWKDSLLIFDPDSTYLQYAVFVPLMLATGSFDELFFSMLQGFRSYGHIGISQIIRSVLRLGLSFTFLVVLHLGTVGLIYSWIISFGVSSIYQFLTLPISKRFVLQRPLLGEILRFGAPLQVTRFLWFLLRRVDILLLAAIAGPTSVAFYSVAARIPDALQRMSEAYIAVYFPTISSMLATGKQKQATLILNRSVRLISLGTALGALVSVLFGSEIMTLLFSHKYAASAPIFAILMLAFHVAFMLNLMGYTMTAAGQPGRSLWANLARVGLNVAGDLALIPYFGAVGAACAGLASAYIANPVAIWLTRKSGTIIEVASYSKQAVLLLMAGGVMLWSQPIHILYRAGILLLFVLLNVILGTVSVDDLNLVLPEVITERIKALLSRRNGEVVTHGN